MKGAGFPAFWFLSIPLMIFFTLLLSVLKHHELLFSTYDFIIVAKSSPLAVFFMINVIIITVLIGSPKPISDHQDAAGDQFITFPPALEYDRLDVKDEENDDNYDGSDVEDLDTYHGYDGYDEENDDDLDTEDDQDSELEDEEDNELERRIEEFIAKVTRKWREEFHTERLLCITAS
ncbi:hypothetical protein REPUB_Repub12eG0193900 [Reevesia pubescens]